MSHAEPHHILFYEYVEDILERRGPHREEHLQRVRAQPGLLMAGALGDPPHGAAFVFRAAVPAEIEAFVAADPYVEAGLVRAWRIEPWAVV
jgi:uncharacterized protein